MPTHHEASTERRIKAVATVSAVDVGAATRKGWDGKAPVSDQLAMLDCPVPVHERQLGLSTSSPLCPQSPTCARTWIPVAEGQKRKLKAFQTNGAENLSEFPSKAAQKSLRSRYSLIQVGPVFICKTLDTTTFGWIGSPLPQSVRNGFHLGFCFFTL